MSFTTSSTGDISRPSAVTPTGRVLRPRKPSIRQLESVAFQTLGVLRQISDTTQNSTLRTKRAYETPLTSSAKIPKVNSSLFHSLYQAAIYSDDEQPAPFQENPLVTHSNASIETLQPETIAPFADVVAQSTIVNDDSFETRLFDDVVFPEPSVATASTAAETTAETVATVAEVLLPIQQPTQPLPSETQETREEERAATPHPVPSETREEITVSKQPISTAPQVVSTSKTPQINSAAARALVGYEDPAFDASIDKLVSEFKARKITRRTTPRIRRPNATIIPKPVLGLEVLKHPNGNIRYCGLTKNGIPHGRGTSFFLNAVMQYSGKFENGTFDDYGTLYHQNGNKEYVGCFENGVFDGPGLWYCPEGKLRYDGDFKAGSCHGIGILLNEDEVLLYEGKFSEGDYSGEGTVYYPTGFQKLAGHFVKGLLNGKGKHFSDKGHLLYDGNFVNGEYEGEGKLYTSEGVLLYSGSFRSGKYHGKGILFDNNEVPIYEGDFVAGVFEGQGFMFDSDGDLINSGEFRGGYAEGEGVSYYKPDANKKQARNFVGPFSKGRPHGHVRQFYGNGIIKYFGECIDGR